MERYGKYKDSGVEWIGEIPVGWEVKKLSRTVEKLTNGYVGPTRGIMQPEGVPYIQGIHIKNNTIRFTPNGNYYVSQKWSDAHEKSILKMNDLLVVQTGTIGDVGIVPIEFEGTNCHALLIVRANKSVFYPKYFLFLLISPYGYASLQQIKTGEILFHINGSKLKGIDVLVPPLNDQTAIANYLDRKTAEIDELITQKERLLELYEEEKNAIINQAVTKGVDPDVKLKDSGIDWLGEIPAGWEVKRFKYLFDLITDKTENDLPKIGLENIESESGTLIQTDTEFEGDGVRFKPGDILFGKLRPYLAKVYLSDFQGKAVGDFFVFRSQDEIYGKFGAKLILSKRFIEITNGSTFGSKMPRVSWNFISNLEIAYPTISEQLSIVHHIESETVRINAKIIKTKRIIELQKEYRTALISEVVTGKIKVTQEAAS